MDVDDYQILPEELPPRVVLEIMKGLTPSDYRHIRRYAESRCGGLNIEGGDLISLTFEKHLKHAYKKFLDNIPIRVGNRHKTDKENVVSWFCSMIRQAAIDEYRRERSHQSKILNAASASNNEGVGINYGESMDSSSPADILIFDQKVREVEDKYEDIKSKNPFHAQILADQMEGMTAKELIEKHGLTKTQYESYQKRVLRGKIKPLFYDF